MFMGDFNQKGSFAALIFRVMSCWAIQAKVVNMLAPDPNNSIMLPVHSIILPKQSVSYKCMNNWKLISRYDYWHSITSNASFIKYSIILLSCNNVISGCIGAVLILWRSTLGFWTDLQGLH
jgi:hypothetical protein